MKGALGKNKENPDFTCQQSSHEISRHFEQYSAFILAPHIKYATNYPAADSFDLMFNTAVVSELECVARLV